MIEWQPLKASTSTTDDGLFDDLFAAVQKSVGDVASDLEEKKRKRRKRKLPKSLSRDEVARLLAQPNLRASTGLRDRVMLELMYRAGLRVGEVCDLEPRDVDLAEGVVHVIEGKGGKDRTAYYDPPEVSPLIADWLAVRRRLGLDWAPTLFCTVRPSNTTLGGRHEPGRPVGRRQVQDMIKRRAAHAGVDPAKVTPHKLRHTFATELLDEGVNLRAVQELLGHADLATTEVYLHVFDADLRKVIQRRRHPLADERREDHRG
jgi:integrase/recombinase XerD